MDHGESNQQLVVAITMYAAACQGLLLHYFSLLRIWGCQVQIDKLLNKQCCFSELLQTMRRYA